MKIQYIKAYTDNYIWLIRTNEGNLVIDPGESKPVESFTSQEGIQINDILLTHHHYDHVGGVLDLKKNILGKVVGPNNSQINGIDHHVVDGETFQSCGLEFSVIEIQAIHWIILHILLMMGISQYYSVEILFSQLVVAECLKVHISKCMNH